MTCYCLQNLKLFSSALSPLLWEYMKISAFNYFVFYKEENEILLSELWSSLQRQVEVFKNILGNKVCP